MGPDQWRELNDTDVEIDVHDKDGKVVAKTLISKTKLPLVIDKHVHLNAHGYAALTVNGNITLLAHFLGGKPRKGLVKDHKNRIKLDNRDENLHDVMRTHNAQNRSKRNHTTSKFQGVSRKARQTGNPWTAAIQMNGQCYTRVFKTENEAARWYDQMAVWLFGSSARLNGFLSQDEILERKQPVLVTLRATRILPRNIYKQRDKFIVRFENPPYCKTFANLEDAARDAQREMARIATMKNTMRLNQDMMRLNQVITKNLNGVAFIVLNSSLAEDKHMNVLVDDNIWHTLIQWKFSWNGNLKTYPSGAVNGRTMSLHVYCWNLYHPNSEISDQLVIAHKVQDRLDCRSENLELRPRAQSVREQKKRKREATSQRVGVMKLKNNVRRPWQANIKIQSRRVYLGSYATVEEASTIRTAIEKRITEIEHTGVTDKEAQICGVKDYVGELNKRQKS